MLPESANNSSTPIQPLNTDSSAETPAKKTRLLQYRAVLTIKPAATKTGIAEMFEYLQDPLCCEVHIFWARKRFELPKLAQLVPKLLCVPASSSPIERVFSAAGFILRPHRARLSYKTLQALVFLKVNAKLLQSL